MKTKRHGIQVKLVHKNGTATVSTAGLYCVVTPYGEVLGDLLTLREARALCKTAKACDPRNRDVADPISYAEAYRRGLHGYT